MFSSETTKRMSSLITRPKNIFLILYFTTDKVVIFVIYCLCYCSLGLVSTAFLGEKSYVPLTLYYITLNISPLQILFCIVLRALNVLHFHTFTRKPFEWTLVNCTTFLRHSTEGRRQKLYPTREAGRVISNQTETAQRVTLTRKKNPSKYSSTSHLLQNNFAILQVSSFSLISGSRYFR